MMRTLWIFGLLATLWLLLSGHTDALLVSFGVFSIILVMYLGRRMRDAAEVKAHIPSQTTLVERLIQIGHYGRYSIWLIKEIVQSNIDVARLVWSPSRKLEPIVLILPDDDLGAIQKVIYANSITLTPGTVSLFLREDGIHVHALTKQAADALKAGEMKRRVKTL